MQKLVMISVLVSIVSMNGCGSASFFGQSKSGKTNQNGDNPNGDNPNNGTQGTSPNGTPANRDPNGPGAPGAPGYKPVPGGDGTCPQEPCDPAQNPSWGPPSEIGSTPNEVIFGKDHVFHIGNGRFENSSCREEIRQLPLSGSIYFFQFEVMQDNVLVDISMERVCGVDYSSGTVQLTRGWRKVGTQNIAPGISALDLPRAELRKGRYTVYVYAGKGDNVRGPSWDIDDFIVGNVRIRASGEGQVIKAGRYGTYR
jgi:hypothetical protein